VLLEKRPLTGIWGGLWSPPEIAKHLSLSDVKKLSHEQFNIRTSRIFFKEPFRHTFSHFHLDILPVVISVNSTKMKLTQHQIWYDSSEMQRIGLPQPVKKFLQTLI